MAWFRDIGAVAAACTTELEKPLGGLGADSPHAGVGSAHGLAVVVGSVALNPGGGWRPPARDGCPPY
jgi:hypothetical protein